MLYFLNFVFWCNIFDHYTFFPNNCLLIFVLFSRVYLRKALPDNVVRSLFIAASDCRVFLAVHCHSLKAVSHNVEPSDFQDANSLPTKKRNGHSLSPQLSVASDQNVWNFVLLAAVERFFGRDPSNLHRDGRAVKTAPISLFWLWALLRTLKRI